MWKVLKAMMFEHLGRMAVCNAYYKKIKDGVHIECWDKDGIPFERSNKALEKAYAWNKDGMVKELLFEGDGIEKTLRTLVNKTFSGVCVGEVKLPITELLYADFTYDHNCVEQRFIAKEIKQSCECYVIYYANNRKRYVCLYCIL